jgi:hypothetical protein
MAGHSGTHLSSPARVGGTNRRIMVQASPGIKEDPISKISHTRRTGRVAQVVEGLPSKHKAQSLNPSTINQKKKKKRLLLAPQPAHGVGQVCHQSLFSAIYSMLAVLSLQPCLLMIARWQVQCQSPHPYMDVITNLGGQNQASL